MCGPALIGVVAAVASTVGTLAAANQQQQAAKYNAKVLDMQAKDSINRGNIAAQEIRDKARRIQGQQAAQFGAAGLDLNFGTPESVLSETKQFGELDALRAISNSQRDAWAKNSQGELELFKGRTQKRAGYMNAAGSLLSSASNIYGMTK